MNIRPATVVPLLAVLAIAGCTSSSSSTAKAKTSAPVTTSGTETLTAVAAGAAAAANLNNNSSNAPLTFPEGVWTGPVAVTVKPFTLPGNGGNGAATVTLDTPAGNATVHHSANEAPGASNPNEPPPATWSKAGKTCYFVTTFSKGTVTFESGTGKFAGATSAAAGTYLVTAQGYAPLKSGDTKCSFTTTSPVEDNGAQVKFTASFPIKVKGAASEDAFVGGPGRLRP